MATFKITIRRAEFYLVDKERRGAGVQYGPDTVLHEEVFLGTLSEVLAHREALSEKFNKQDHAAVLSHLETRNPRGFSAVRNKYNSVEFPNLTQI